MELLTPFGTVTNLVMARNEDVRACMHRVVSTLVLSSFLLCGVLLVLPYLPFSFALSCLFCPTFAWLALPWLGSPCRTNHPNAHV